MRAVGIGDMCNGHSSLQWFHPCARTPLYSEDWHKSGRLERHRCEKADSLLVAHLDHCVVGNLLTRR
jgi:hypothetical protein